MTSDMYGAQGRIGNKTYYRSNGKTVAREIVAVKNPKTNLQTLQRVIAKQVNMSYKMLKNICDHSFEGITNGANCAAKFRKLNMRYARERAAEDHAKRGDASEDVGQVAGDNLDGGVLGGTDVDGAVHDARVSEDVA